MKHALLLAFLLVLTAGVAQAVEPQSTDQFDNPEEPALRPYKWIFHGFKGLVYHPAKSFVDGNMNTPVLGTVEITRGARRGVVRFGESTWNGVLFRPLPEKDEYQEMGEINEKLEKEKHDKFLLDALSNLPVSIALEFPLFPVQVLVDKYPAESDEKVRLRQEEARKTRDSRKAARDKNAGNLTDVERAQRNYVGDRATAGKQEHKGGGNLLKRFG